MAKLVAVDRQKIEKGTKGLQKLLDREPDLKKQEEEELEAFEKRVAADNKRRDTEHREQRGG